VLLLLGDLFYLDITTLEGKSVTVTAWANGFFVNGCTATQFNPEPAAVSYESHALVDLLNSVSTMNSAHRLAKHTSYVVEF
jgi:protein TIF31